MKIEEIVKKYKDKKFTAAQLDQIKLACIEGLSEKEIELMANEQLEAAQMLFIRRTIEEGIDNKYIEKEICNKSTLEEMVLSKRNYFKKMIEELIEEVIKEKYNSLDELINNIIDKKINQLEKEDIEEESCTKNQSKIRLLIDKIRNKDLEREKSIIDIICNPKFTSEQMELIQKAYSDNIPLKDISKFSIPEYDIEQMKCVAKTIYKMKGISFEGEKKARVKKENNKEEVNMNLYDRDEDIDQEMNDFSIDDLEEFVVDDESFMA